MVTLELVHARWAIFVRPVAGVAFLLGGAALHGTLIDRVDQRYLAAAGARVVLHLVFSWHAVRGCIRPVRVQRLLAVLRHLVEPLYLQVTVLSLQPRGRLHAVLDSRARGHKPLLTLAAIVAGIQTVTGRSATRVLRMLRNRVLGRLVIHFRDAGSDNLIALVFILTQSEGGLRRCGGFSLRVTKLWLAFEHGGRSYLFNLDDRGLNSLRL